MPTTWTIPEILQAFETGRDYQREAVEAALELGHAAVPRLVELLGWVAEEPAVWVEDQERVDHIYAAVLVGYLGAQEAHPVLIDLLSLPGEVPFELFSDMVHEQFPALLLRTSGGSLERMDALLQNREANPYCRAAAADAMTFALAAGQVERAEVIARVGEAFSRAIDDTTEDVEMCSLLAGMLGHLCPAELMPKIRRGYALELIDVTHVTLAELESTLEEGEEAALEARREWMAMRMPESIHDWLGDWACLGHLVYEEERDRRRQEQRQRKQAQAKADSRAQRRGQGKKKRAKRKKRKAARAARRR
jgi:hypothetical protein